MTNYLSDLNEQQREAVLHLEGPLMIIAGAGKGNWLLIVIAALNMIISMAYYLRIVKVMFMDTNESPLQKVEMGWSPRIAMVICIGGILVTGVVSGAYEYIYSLVSQCGKDSLGE